MLRRRGPSRCCHLDFIDTFIDSSTVLIDSVADWEVGDFINVTGFAGQYEEAYEILPRIAPDIKKQAAQD